MARIWLLLKQQLHLKLCVFVSLIEPHLNWPVASFHLHSGREATRFAVAATNQNTLIGRRPVFLRHVTRAVFYVGCATFCVLIGRSHGELSRFIDAQFGWNEVSCGEICDMNTS